MNPFLIKKLEDFISSLSPLPPHVYNLTGSSKALLLSLIKEHYIMVETTEESASRLYGDVLFFRRFSPVGPDVSHLPAPEGPYASGQRANIALKFIGGESTSIMTSKEALSSYLWRPDVTARKLIQLKPGSEIKRDGMESLLSDLGYVSVPIVTERGQYRLKGFILDIFPSDGALPLRAEFFGDEVESLRFFDIETQRSVSDVGECRLLPAREPEGEGEGFSLMDDKGSFGLMCSEEIYSWMPEGTVVLSEFSFMAGAEGQVPPEGIDAGVLSVSGHGILPSERQGIGGIVKAIERLRGENRIMIVCSSMGQAERLRDIFSDGGLTSPVMNVEELIGYEGRISISVGELSSGLFLPGLMILTDNELFGGRPQYRALKKSKASKLMAEVEDLEVGDLIVHEDHGIGRFAGVVRENVEGYECDLMTIEYSGGGRLYLPLYGIGKIAKYHCAEGIAPAIDSLGSRRWQRKKERVRKRIREMAGKLLGIYAEREVLKGFSFSSDTELHREFDRFFPYDETPDQMKSIEEIKADMESEKPMDRLLCGDVGYGKTEVAMRAAFKAVYDGRQVAVLVPTTLLCEQHHRTFGMRFSAFSVKVDYISRFKSKKEQAATAGAAQNGEIDILIGTHGLLNVSFPNLGLLIIDEEHRFGVAQKEKIKELKKGVDVLTLSATPIPRTLQMAISGIRNMSVIETPPEERLAVKTVVSQFDEKLIREAIGREIERGGQAFFVHNRIESITKLFNLLKNIVPYARCGLAHGQMKEREIEKVMLSFLNRDIDVLVTTAIIGSGIDIPTANTLILNMADKMGLADLYQLRGRVGRGNVRAFAYFLVPREELISGQVKKRLQAIKELSFLGAGFRVAMKDLEIRGAGNLLGAEQSGYINDVGFDMYLEMLENAVAELKGVEVREKAEPAINIKLNAFIPEDYIVDMAVRLGVYRRIASAVSVRDIEELGTEMEDRFGNPPEEFTNLLRVMEIKITGGKLFISGIKQEGMKVRFSFLDGAHLAPDKILEMFYGRVRFLSDGFEASLEGAKPIYEELMEMLRALEAVFPQEVH